MNERVAYRFGPFRLDPARRTFQREAEYIQLPPKVFNCLVYLLDHRERAVSHEELLDAVWGTEHLSAGVIPQTMLLIRRALKDGRPETEYVESLRGFGYRWTAPVEVEEPVDAAPAATAASAAPEATPGERPRPVQWRRLLWAGALAAVLGMLVAAALYLYRQRTPEPMPPITDGSVALLLPVTVDAAPEDAWIRLGVMDFIAERLHAAGLNMVSSDTVIALLGKQGGEVGRDGYEKLTRTTGARLALTAHAQKHGTRWRVSLQIVKGADPPLSAAGEAGDVIEAARIATDKMASSLGLTPELAPGVDPALARLSQQIQAALLTGDVAAAGALVHNAPAALRRQPEIRFAEGHVALASIKLDAAQEIFDSLLRESERDPAADPVFRAKLLNGLGIIQAHRNDWTKAESLLGQAVAIVGDPNAPSWAGTARVNLSGMAILRGDHEAAGGQLEHARRIFSSRSDLRGLAMVDSALAAIADLRGRLGDALRYRQSATERFQAVGDRPNELGTRAMMQATHLQLMDSEAAAAQQSRIRELSAQVTEPRQLLIARLAEAVLANAEGRLAHSEAQFGAALEITRAHPDLAWSVTNEMVALSGLADQALRDGRYGRASALASRVVRDSHEAYAPVRASAWLTLMRSQMAVENMAGARASAAALGVLAEQGQSRSVAIGAHLARAELAVAEGRSAAAAAEYQQALGLAESGQVPVEVVDVIASYLPWWLGEHGASGADQERAVQLAGRVAPYADDWFDAAVVQLRLYHALGDATAWRAALAQARRLAGERHIPQELQTLPAR